jgi:tetratricopeptide (TPR) repeat protein
VEAVTASRAFAVATPDRVNKVRGYMRRAPDAALDAASAREAARRDGGIRAVITGSVAGSGDRPAIEVRIVAPVSGANVATIKEASAGGEVGRVLDALRVGVTGALDAQQEALPPPIAEYEHVTTASFEALRTYTEGRAAFERRDYRGAADLFQRATTLDPDFALAYTWLGWIRFNAGSPYVGEFAKGDELARKLSPEERLWARGSHLVGLHDERAFADFWDLLQLDPLHTWALHNLAAHVRDDPHESERLIYYWERQAAANPNDVKSLHETARALLFSTHAERAWPYVDRILKLAKDRPDGAVPVYRAFALTARAKDAWGRSRVSETVERMGPVCDAVTGRPKDMEQIQAFCNSLRVALGQLQRADPYANEWEKADIAIFATTRKR